MMTNKEFLKKYINNAAPVGFEKAGQEIWLEYLKSVFDDYKVDNYGSVIGMINPKADYKVVIEAHADEISWFVNYITKEGYIYVIRNGGTDPQIAPSMRVNLHTKNGAVKGVIGWPAIHVRQGDKHSPKHDIENLVVDCGCSSLEEVEELGIHVGTPITYVDELMELNDKYYVGRALDNRMGGYMIAEVAKKIKENNINLDYCLCVVNSVQEEIGLKGAEMVAQGLKPDLAIITDVCHDTQSPHYKKIIDGDTSSGKGPVLSYAPAVHNLLRDKIIEVAESKEIPFQRMASSRSTGTDTDSFAYSNGGVPAALISLPLKYMHTTVETVHKEDVENVINLMYEFLVQLKAGENWKYLQ